MFKISGKIKKVFQTETFGTFEKRTFWLEEVSEKYPNTWQLEFWKDDTKMGDSYREGDFVTCFIDIKGKSYSKKDGGEGVINSLKCWNIEKDGKTYKEIKTSKPQAKLEDLIAEDDDDDETLFPSKERLPF